MILFSVEEVAAATGLLKGTVRRRARKLGYNIDYGIPYHIVRQIVNYRCRMKLKDHMRIRILIWRAKRNK